MLLVKLCVVSKSPSETATDILVHGNFERDSSRKMFFIYLPLCFKNRFTVFRGTRSSEFDGLTASVAIDEH